MAQALSLNVSNSVGGSNRAPILVASEYHHWSQRMESYLKRLERDLWRPMEEGPHAPFLTPVHADVGQSRLGAGQAAMNRQTNNDLEKMQKDAIAFYEISCGVSLDNFDIFIKCKSTKGI